MTAGSASTLGMALTSTCTPFKNPGAVCSSSAQCGTTYAAPSFPATWPASGGITYATPRNLLSTCKGGFCCKSSTCTTSCDSFGNCLGDTCSSLSSMGARSLPSAVYSAIAGRRIDADSNMCYYVTQPSLPLASQLFISALPSTGGAGESFYERALFARATIGAAH